jgi:hypothetical protein
MSATDVCNVCLKSPGPGEVCYRHDCPGGPDARLAIKRLPPVPVLTPPMGCICPPGANKDCEAPMCPRQRRDMITGMRIKP